MGAAWGSGGLSGRLGSLSGEPGWVRKTPVYRQEHAWAAWKPENVVNSDAWGLLDGPEARKHRTWRSDWIVAPRAPKSPKSSKSSKSPEEPQDDPNAPRPGTEI